MFLILLDGLGFVQIAFDTMVKFQFLAQLLVFIIIVNIIIYLSMYAQIYHKLNSLEWKCLPECVFVYTTFINIKILFLTFKDYFHICRIIQYYAYIMIHLA